MGLKQEIEALKEEAAAQGISETALWLDRKISTDIIPAINILDRRNEKTDERSETITDLVNAVNAVGNNKLSKVMIDAPPATDLATAITLLNEIKQKLNQ